MSRNNPIFIRFLILLVSILVLFAFLSCKTMTVAPTAHSETHDSIRTEYRQDSIYVDRWHSVYVKGDTVLIHDSIDRWRTRTDSVYKYVYVNTCDTITQTIEVEKEGAAFWKGSGIAFWVLIGLMTIGITIGLIIKFAK